MAGAAFALGPTPASAEPGISADSIRLAGVMDLRGRSSGLGQGMKKGLEAALQGQTLKGRRIELMFLDDAYTPEKTVAAVNELLAKEPFLFIGNVGTPTAKAALPILAKAGVPAFGFFTGAGLLRPGEGSIVNFRASYEQETAKVIDDALAAGVRADQICAYVQNDAYGMSGVAGVVRALKGKAGAETAVAAMEKALAMEGEDPMRNGIGPLGVYRRNTFVAREGYQSLKQWEKSHNAQCRLVVTVGAYTSISNFIAYSRSKGEKWVASAVSFTGANNLSKELIDNNIKDRVIMTQVTPLLESGHPIVAEARQALGEDLGYVSLEGFIVGKLFLHLMGEIEGEPTRAGFMQAVAGKQFDLGGLAIDFSNDNQASDLVTATHLTDRGWQLMGPGQWAQWLK
ncbi:MAG: ABC transporter substrate-binding protein [Gammaproteobacteria bacterium]|nr:ABC transporter substrate-binding protein [Gammaproteobacteria bacterium]MBU1654852.1 ABC transporter substrate-binding protein [Gammaproteobacteria bacterium]MBU1961143.1 ABC transporter substrate-binding protein [Gammaproteobacteria bacterium]